ncbi:MAG TPA: cytochrome P460 family protein [Gemmatimonadales bacterium]|nr:cytochrome P460 family protein [Gemmatimonadales bacterium]
MITQRGRSAGRAALVLLLLADVGTSMAQGQKAPGEDKYALKVPGGLAFAEFKGYETWQVISVSQGGPHLAVIVGNQQMIDAFKAGIPDNGKPFPDGARMAKVHYVPKTHAIFPTAKVPALLHDVDFMVKDSKRFRDSGGWGYAAFIYDTATGKYRPGNTTDTPPQANDAKCGAACHSVVQKRDYVFTYYQPR